MSDGLNRILYVEDEPDIRKVAQLALETIGGFEVVVCASGAEAIEKAAAFAPDMLLVDVMMPGMDGPTTLVELRKLPPLANTPAVFLTAKVLTNEVAEYREMGALDIIAKPFDPVGLAKRVREIWDNR